MINIRKLKKYCEFWWFRKTFYQRFNFYLTESEEELDEIYKIRYRVYCEEFNYLDKSNYPDKKEFDEYDDKSVHFVLREKKTNEVAATLRLILNSEIGFPSEKHFEITLHISPDDRNKMAEISRLIVARKFRKHFLLLSLFKGMYAYVNKQGITHVYSVMDDKLCPLLKKMGFPFKQIGPTSIYQGITSPYIMDISEMLEDLKTVNPKLYRYILGGLLEYNNIDHSYSIH